MGELGEDPRLLASGVSGALIGAASWPPAETDVKGSRVSGREVGTSPAGIGVNEEEDEWEEDEWLEEGWEEP